MGARHTSGKGTGPNPTDRRVGTKHHVLTDAQSILLASIVTGPNAHDVTQQLPLVQAYPPIRENRPDLDNGLKRSSSNVTGRITLNPSADCCAASSSN